MSDASSPSEESPPPPQLPSVTPEAAPRSFIEEIRLVNFMCHENFRLRLCPGLNIIYGTNGSGKSTILTAVMIGLGSRARSTSRGTSLASFIKSGRQQALIKVKIRIPPQYYTLYEKYGGEVTVTRTLRSSGSSSVVLQDANGRRHLESASKAVAQICSYCGIFPSNELAMLSQENAKEFLVTATGKVKYRKLQEALHQVEIERNEREIHDSHARRSEVLARNARSRQHLEDVAARCRELLNRAQTHSSAQSSLAATNRALRWQEVDAAQHALSRAEELCRSVRAEISAEAAPQQLQDEIRQQREFRDQLADSQAARESAVAPLEQSLEGAEQQRADAVMDLQNAQKDAEDFAAQIAEIEQQLAELRKNNADISWEALEARRKQLGAAISEIHAARPALEAEHRDLRAREAECREAVAATAREISELEKQRHALTASVRQKEQQLRDALSGTAASNPSAGRAASYSSEQHQLAEAVARTPGFRHKPVGPIFSLLMAGGDGVKFMPAVERLLGRDLSSWWVRNRSDGDKLQALAQRHGLQIRVIERADDVWDVERVFPEKSEDYIRIPDVITAAPEIMRLLVDQSHVESLVLVEGLSEGYEIAKRRGISRVVVLIVRNSGEKSFRLIESSNAKTDSSFLLPARDLCIPVSQDGLKTALQEQLSAYKSELAEINEAIAGLQLRLRDQKAAAADIKEQLDAAAHKIQHNNKRASELTEELHQVEDSTKLADNSAEIEEAEQKLVSLVEEYSFVKETVEGIKADLREKEEAAKSARSAYDQARRAVQRLERDIEECSASLRDLERQESDTSARQDRLNQKLYQAEHTKEACEANLLNVKSEVEKAVGPINADDQETQRLRGQSRSILEQRITELEAELQLHSADATEIEKTHEELEKTQGALSRLDEEDKVWKNFDQEMLKRAALRGENRQRVWEGVKRRVQQSFTEILSRRRFSGHVTINDSTKVLVAEASPESEENRGTSTLSGGEKSYVQIALLMAVWENMDIGLTAMDEYDVYMDKTNRSASLLALAESIGNSHMQCILITPQDIDTDILANTNVDFVVHKMQPART